MFFVDFLGCSKQLRDVFDTTTLRETTIRIIKIFMSTGRLHHWLDYLMPEDNQSSITGTLSTDDGATVTNNNKFDQLMMETRAVLLRYEDYRSTITIMIIDSLISLKVLSRYCSFWLFLLHFLSRF